MRRAAAALLFALGGSALAPSAFAQSVSMSGSLGDKALLVIDGTPRTLAVGSTVNGVKLLGVTGSDALVEVKGQRVKLLLGGAQVNIGGANSAGGGTQIVLTADGGGHFFTTGSINGKATRFIVDTGATFVSMGVDEATSLGIDYRKGERGVAQSANGPMIVYQLKLASVRIGDVQVYDIDALISPRPIGVVLLGNSYLSHFQMKRDNDTMTLSKRY